jgi:hypothetical protein
MVASASPLGTEEKPEIERSTCACAREALARYGDDPLSRARRTGGDNHGRNDLGDRG